MELTTENKVKLKSFYDAGNIEDMGKLMYQLNIKKVPYTQLGKAVGVTDYIAKSYIKTYKNNYLSSASVTKEKQNLKVELARVEKVATQHSQFSEAIKLHISRGFSKYSNDLNLSYQISLIEVVGDFFRVGVNATSKKEPKTMHFVEYVNFDVDFKPLVELWAAVLGSNYIQNES